MSDETVDFRIGDLVLYKNNQLIAFNKPPGLAVQEDKTGDRALINLGEIFCKSTLHLIHRIDRPASGVVLFAKTKNALAHLNEQVRDRKIIKTYLAVVKDHPPKEADHLIHFIKKNGKTNKAMAYPKQGAGTKQAELSYKVIGQIDNYYLLEIDLKTGRHHQVRAQLAALGNPIKGDIKYGFRRGNRDRSIHLHARALQFAHPVSGELTKIEAPLPKDPVWEAFGLD